MKEPRRWRDSTSSPEIGRMLKAGRPTARMPGDARARLARRVGKATLGSLVISLLLSAKGVAAAALAGVAAAAMTLAIVATVHLHATRTAALPSLPSSPPQHAAPHVSPALPRVPDEPMAAPSTSSAPPATPALASSNQIAMPSATYSERLHSPDPAVAAPQLPGREHVMMPERQSASSAQAPSHDTLLAELARLDAARARLAADPAAALALLDGMAREFPMGKLRLEGELLALDALDRLGRKEDRRSRAARTLPMARGSIYEARVREHLERP